MGQTDLNEEGNIIGYHHITLWVGNAKQAATHYCVHFGFTPYAYKGLENGSRDVVSHVIRLNDIIFEFQSPLKTDHNSIAEYLVKHGDGVKDIAFTVDNVDAIIKRAVSNGAVVLSEIKSCGNDGQIYLSTIEAFGDITHTFIDTSKFNGHYLPDYIKSPLNLSVLSMLPSINLKAIDHWAGVQPEGVMESVVESYEKLLSFKRYWSIDETVMHSEYSSFRAVVLTDPNNTIKFNIAEPAPGKRKSQTQEFLDFNGGPGVHHFAFITDNIIKDMKSLKARGVEFVKIPDAYYKQLRERLNTSKVIIAENLDSIQELGLLLDFDDIGYLLQIFSKPVQDRPTLCIEIIQRYNFDGFGAGNFKALYEAMVAEQIIRGNV